MALAPMKFYDGGDQTDNDTKHFLGEFIQCKWMVRLASGWEGVRHASEMDIQSAAY